jgi:hypothetical protein
LDKKAKAVIARIKKLEAQIAKLEVKKKAAFRKVTQKRAIKPKGK